MQAELTKELYQEVKKAAQERDAHFLRTQLERLHPADVADMVDEFEHDEAMYLFSQLEPQKAFEVLVELDEDVRNKLLAELPPEEIAIRIIEELDSDDAADLINDMPLHTREQVVEALNERHEESHEVMSLLEYPEDTAGGLMARELVKVNINCRLEECFQAIREQAEEIESIYAVYVVDDSGQLKGIVPLQRLIANPPQTHVKDITNTDIAFARVDQKAEEIANMMDRYDLVAMPVVDEYGYLVGRITIDDVVDFIREEAEEDYQLASGISEDVEYSDSVWRLSRARIPWLLLGLLGGIASSRIISQYEDQLQVQPEMAFFIPLIAAMGGNAGVQSSAIIVQSLAADTLGSGTVFTKVLKEFGVAMINGLLCSTILLGYGFLIHTALGLAITISVALLTVIIIASVSGVLIPLGLNRLKVDPALATGPFITTTNDLIGMAVYFLVGRLMYGLIV